jgi:MATE family multidrug resistance protein
MTMGVVDTYMVGDLGPEAIGAVGLGSAIFTALAIFGMGLLLGLDTLVAQAFGARRLDECHRWLLHGVYMSLLLTLPLAFVVWVVLQSLGRSDLHPSVLRLTVPYLRILDWGMLPLLLYAAFRRYLQGMGLVRPVMFALLSANVVNAAGNWVLISGRLGAPALGTDGSAWATCIARVYMASVLLWAIIRHDRRYESGLRAISARLEVWRLRRLFGLGAPAASQVTLEVGVFAMATALAGRLEPLQLAAHQIALNIASMSFMVPLGIASAGAVRVGQAIGRLDPRGAERSGWTALAIAGIFMSLMAILFLVAPVSLIEPFTRDARVIAIAVTLLFIAAVFQLFDGLQVVATGILRGLGDTRTPMLWNLAGHWVFGLPLGYTLCFRSGWGVTGLWVGLSVGLMSVGVILVGVWRRRVRLLVA